MSTGYYVSVIDGQRYGLLLGPFASHPEALGQVKEGKRLARTVNDRAIWYAYGTCKVDADPLPTGRLNTLAGR